MVGKKQRARVGMQHLNSRCDWPWWQCNGRRFTVHANVFFSMRSQPGQCYWRFSSLFFTFVQTKQTNERHSSLLSISPEQQYVFSWLTSCRNLMAIILSLYDLNQSLSHSLRLMCWKRLKTVEHKCILCCVSTTWLFSLRNCSQRPRVTSPAYSIKHKWLFSLT